MHPELAQIVRPRWRVEALERGQLVSPLGKIGPTRLAPPPGLPGAAKFCLLGEAPGPNTRPDCPLFPYPERSSGGRLFKFLGLPYEAYFAMLRLDLITYYPGPGGVPLSAARAAWHELLPQLQGYDVLCFGVRVRAGVGIRADWPALQWTSREPHTGIRVAWAQHPSGLNRHYDDASNQEALRNFVGACLLPTGAS